jgi:hypothetical protein
MVSPWSIVVFSDVPMALAAIARSVPGHVAALGYAENPQQFQ